MDFTALIEGVGFPIACVIALGMFVWQTVKDMRTDFLSRENRLLANNEKMIIALDKSADAITESTKQHDVICSNINKIEGKVDEINRKVDGLPKA